MHAAVRPTTAPPEDNRSDAELAAAAAAGDTLAFGCIMRRHNRLLFRSARSVLRHDADAEDALQDAWFAAWRGIGRFRGDSRLATWLVRIVLNEALGRVRRRGAEVLPLHHAAEADAGPVDAGPADEPERQPDAAVMRAELRRLMEARIDALPEVFRTVFVLRAVQELEVEEIAVALAVPEATVRTRFFRARSLLREGLACDMDMALADAFAFDGERCDRIVARVQARLRSQR